VWSRERKSTSLLKKGRPKRGDDQVDWEERKKKGTTPAESSRGKKNIKDSGENLGATFV